ncbi:hypothetical protein HLI_21505 (plasmid) [Halobacillus litoralis]|uniref:Uncharacterized protein n=1 Tax=Halobacillus litoralis TaxID=45668 RepID=A0A410MJC6_9BACI|nr:hypothetical protein HLI_21505 [Halobacillus litoralis]
MSFDFFTKNSVYTVEDTCVYKNGELLAQGKVNPLQVLLGLPGAISVYDPYSGSSNNIWTGEIRSILPQNERINKLSLPTRNRYVVRVRVDCRNREFVVNAIDESHSVKHLKSFFKHMELISVHQVNSSYVPATKEESVCC